jgi:acylphosphatase
MRLHVVVRGRVQGVGFRWFVREVARSLDLAGWVKNRADGTVEVVAEGADEAMRQLRSDLAQGPDGARVESVDDLEPNSESLERPFGIRK